MTSQQFGFLSACKRTSSHRTMIPFFTPAVIVALIPSPLSCTSPIQSSRSWTVAKICVICQKLTTNLTIPWENTFTSTASVRGKRYLSSNPNPHQTHHHIMAPSLLPAHKLPATSATNKSRQSDSAAIPPRPQKKVHDAGKEFIGTPNFKSLLASLPLQHPFQTEPPCQILQSMLPWDEQQSFHDTP